MKIQRSLSRLLAVAAAVALVLYVCSPAAATSAKLKDLKSQAQNYEAKAQWGKACSVYGKMLELQSNAPDIREHYFDCLRRYLQECRHSDPSYLNEVLKLKLAQSERLLEFILTYLNEHALEPSRATPKALFNKGLEELDYALASSVFVSTHLEKASKESIAAFRKSLQETWKKKPINTVPQAVNLVHAVAHDASKKLGLKMVTAIMEFTCGSCYALDDYTMYLTPSELRSLCSSLKGESVGIGLKLGIKGDKMIITDIAPDSPAKTELKLPLAPFDQVLSIDGKSTVKMPPEVAADLMCGEAGTEVELEIYSPVHGNRIVSLPRRFISMPSVRYEMMSSQVGYLAISNFQTSTVQELDAALSSLSKMEINALVLDLRGNSGGIFGVAVDAARRFLKKGVIVSTQTEKQTTTYDSQNASALTLPLVVLVDGKTASSAEILAGALKENSRARLVGLPTFGKGCIQEVYSLSPGNGVAFPGGLRVTVARFLSPNGHPYTGKGIQPHIMVEQDPMGKADLQLQEALDEALRLIEVVDKPEVMKM